MLSNDEDLFYNNRDEEEDEYYNSHILSLDEVDFEMEDTADDMD